MSATDRPPWVSTQSPALEGTRETQRGDYGKGKRPWNMLPDMSEGDSRCSTTSRVTPEEKDSCKTVQRCSIFGDLLMWLGLKCGDLVCVAPARAHTRAHTAVANCGPTLFSADLVCRKARLLLQYLITLNHTLRRFLRSMWKICFERCDRGIRRI